MFYLVRRVEAARAPAGSQSYGSSRNQFSHRPCRFQTVHRGKMVDLQSLTVVRKRVGQPPHRLSTEFKLLLPYQLKRSNKSMLYRYRLVAFGGVLCRFSRSERHRLRQGLALTDPVCF